ncbi:MAG: MEDS domain-containing protein [Candidatus Edwardsbacteria bacterium]|nr:MEDS domain-containing protein [Candidatus Edwardsbacteria bacterium]
MGTQQRRVASMGFTEERFPAGTHMCLIYDDENERRKLIAKYLDAGLREREKVAYFVDTMPVDEVRDWLAGMGVKMPKEDQLTLASAEKTYCPNGKFVPDEMMDGLRVLHQGSLDEGYSGARASGEMTWALRGIPGSERLIEYENLLNIVFETSPIVGLCQYDARRFSGALIFDILKVHPMMIVHGQVVKNPYYMRPEEFLRSKN